MKNLRGKFPLNGKLYFLLFPIDLTRVIKATAIPAHNTLFKIESNAELFFRMKVRGKLAAKPVQ